ncbi:hypothetical protein K1719_026221 [Acacia pycnantha]|nr:hypothetical protein K1719_026221 [Acacia pycnantha]
MLVCAAVSLTGSSSALGFGCGIVLYLLLKLREFDWSSCSSNKSESSIAIPRNTTDAPVLPPNRTDRPIHRRRGSKVIDDLLDSVFAIIGKPQKVDYEGDEGNGVKGSEVWLSQKVQFVYPEDGNKKETKSIFFYFDECSL